MLSKFKVPPLNSYDSMIPNNVIFPQAHIVLIFRSGDKKQSNTRCAGDETFIECGRNIIPKGKYPCFLLVLSLAKIPKHNPLHYMYFILKYVALTEVKYKIYV